LTARYALAAVPARLREAVNQATVHTTVHTPSAHAAKSLKTKGRP
jgi:hypothetical protein